MTATRFLDLYVISGPDKGMRYSIEEGTYRIIGKREDASFAEERVTSEGDRILNPDQLEIIYLHIKTYSDNSRLKFQKRGPDILLNDLSVSRMHVMVLMIDLKISIAELTSTCKIQINDNPLYSAILKEGDLITVGSTKLMALIG
jgi:FHA domain